MSFAGVSAALESGRLPHALLFLGPSGAGQREAARSLAQALFCGKKKGSAGCGECASCRLVASGNHPDFRVWEPLEESRTLKVEQVRQMISEANFKPFQAPAKVFVIDPAEALNETSQNALLKTLEEPPLKTYLVLICHAAEALLPTVRSRLRTVHFSKSAAAGPGGEALERAKNALWRRVETGRTALAPDLSGLTREETLEALEDGIQRLRETLLARVGSGEEDGLIRRIETLAEYKQKVSQNANTKLTLAVLWEEL